MAEWTKDDIIELLVGILAGGRGGGGLPPPPDLATQMITPSGTPKQKRTASPAQKRYGRAFKRLAPKYKKKNGQWKKDGFKRCVRAAHRACRSGKR